MVVISAARVTQREPRTHLAVVRGFGVGIRFELPRLFELTPHFAEISDVALEILQRKVVPRFVRDLNFLFPVAVFMFGLIRPADSRIGYVVVGTRQQGRRNVGANRDWRGIGRCSGGQYPRT